MCWMYRNTYPCQVISFSLIKSIPKYLHFSYKWQVIVIWSKTKHMFMLLIQGDLQNKNQRIKNSSMRYKKDRKKINK